MKIIIVKCGVCSAAVASKLLKIEYSLRTVAVSLMRTALICLKSFVEFMLEEKQIWHCSSRASMALNTSVDEGKASNSEVISMLIEAKNNCKRLENELGKSLNSRHKKIEENVRLDESQTKTIKEYLKKIKELTEENKTLRAKVNNLEEKIEEQYSHLNCVEIRGVPMESNENIIETVIKVGMALDMTIKEEMVDVCHWLRNRNNGNPPEIIVKFVRRLDKQTLLQKGIHRPQQSI